MAATSCRVSSEPLAVVGIPSLTNSNAGPYSQYTARKSGDLRTLLAVKQGFVPPGPALQPEPAGATPHPDPRCPGGTWHPQNHHCMRKTQAPLPESGRRAGLERRSEERSTIRSRGGLPLNCTFLCNILPESGKIQQAKSPTCSVNQEVLT